MEKKANLKTNLIMSISYKILTLFVPLLTTPYLSRVLGAEGIGTYSYEYSIAYYFMLFIMLGLENYGNRTIAEVSHNKEERSRIFWEIYTVQIINAIISSVAFTIYVIFFAQNKTMGWIMFGFIVSAAIDITWFFYGIEEITATVLRNLLIKLLTLVLIFTCVKQQGDIYRYALIMSISTAVSQACLWVLLKKQVYFVKVSFRSIVKHIKPLYILFIPVLAVSLYRVMDKIMLGSMTLKSEVGFYESAEKIVQLPIQVINAFGIVMMPRITNLLSLGEEDKTFKYINSSIKGMMLISAFLSFGIMAVSNMFVPLFYGPGYEKCIGLFYILLPSSWFLAFSNVLRTQYLIPKKKDKLYIISIFCGAIVNMVVNLILISKLASIGAAIGTLCAEATVCIVQSIGIRKELPIWQYFVTSIWCIAVGCGMYMLIKLIPISFKNNIINLLVAIIIGIIYAIPFLMFLYKKIRAEVS